MKALLSRKTKRRLTKALTKGEEYIYMLSIAFGALAYLMLLIMFLATF